MTITAQDIIVALKKSKADLENAMLESSPSQMGIVTWYETEDRIEFLDKAIAEIQSILDRNL